VSKSPPKTTLSALVLSERGQITISSLLLAVIMVWLHFYQQQQGSLLETFDFTQPLVWQEPWRLLTAHILHLDAQHAIYNAIGLLLLTLFFAGNFTLRSWFNALLIIAVVIAALVWLIGYPSRFVGFSAILHGLLLLGVLLDWRQQDYQWSDWLNPIVLGLLGLKVLLEYYGLLQSKILLSIGDPQAIGILHACGLVGGILAWHLHCRSLKALATLTESNQDK